MFQKLLHPSMSESPLILVKMDLQRLHIQLSTSGYISLICTKKCIVYIAATNQEVAEQNWHSNQKNDEEDIGSWAVEKSALVEDCFKIKLSS